MSSTASNLNLPVDWCLDGSSGALVGVLDGDYDGAAVLTPINRQSWLIRIGGFEQTWRQSSRAHAQALANLILFERAKRREAAQRREAAMAS